MQVKYQSSEVTGSIVKRCGYNSLFPWNQPGRSTPACQETQMVRNSLSRAVRLLEAPPALARPAFCRSNSRVTCVYSMGDIVQRNYMPTCPIRRGLHRRGRNFVAGYLAAGAGEESLRFSNRWCCPFLLYLEQLGCWSNGRREGHTILTPQAPGCVPERIAQAGMG